MRIRTSFSVGRTCRFGVAFVLVLSLLGAISGCGGETSDGSSSTASASTTPLTSHQLVHAALLSPETMGSDWKPTRPTRPAPCGRTGWEEARAHGASPSYHLRYGSVQENVAMFATERRAASVYEALQTPQLRRCLSRALLVGVRTNGGQGSISKPSLVMSDEASRSASSTRLVIRADSILGIVSVYADQVRIRSGRVVSVLVMVEIGHPIDEAIYERVVAAVRGRTADLIGRQTS